MKGVVLNPGETGNLSPSLITQESGDSTTLIMSQKAVTDLVSSVTLGSLAFIYVPTFYQDLVYTGEEITPEFNDYSPDYLKIGGITSATDAGKYTATFTPKPGYKWLDGTSGIVEVDWEIQKAPGRCVLSQTSCILDSGQIFEFTVDAVAGAALKVTSANTTIAQAEISGNKVTITGGLDDGSTTITVTADATNNHNGASATFAVTNYLESIAVPSTQDVTYNGSSQNPHWLGLDQAKMETTGTLSATDAGSYSAGVRPKPGYRWQDGTTGIKDVPWRIQKATGTLSLSAVSGTVNKGDKVTLTASTSTNGAITASSSNTNIATVTYSGSTVTITGGSTAGQATITVVAAASANYNEVQQTYTLTNYLGSLTVPTTTDRTYNGSSQAPNWSGLDTAKMTTGGTLAATDAGTYTATVTPKSGYRWTDGTTGAKSISWKIAKAAGTITLSASSGTVDKGKTVQITATVHASGTVSAVSADINKATVSVSSKTVTITGGNTAGSVTITIKASSTTNYNEASATYTLTNYLGSLTVPTTTNRTYTGSSQSPNWSGLDTAKMTTGGTLTGTNASSYNATVTPKTGYRWTDGTTGAKTVTWKIDKAAGSLSVDKTTVTLNNVTPTATIQITQVGDGAINVTSSNPSVVTATLDGTKINIGGG